MIKRYLDFIGESLEFLLESDVVYSEKFRKVISNILSPISSKLLEIENKDLPVRSNYFDILKDKNDTITFLPDRKAQEILKDNTKEMVSFRGDGGWLTNNIKENGAIFDLLGYTPQTETPYKPQSSDVGEVFKSVVSPSSGKTWVWVKFANGEGVYNQQKLTKIDDSSAKLWGRGRQEIGVGRGIRALLSSTGEKIVDKELEEFVNLYKSAIDKLNDKFFFFEEVKGNDIGHWYNCDNYYARSGQLGSSCMASVDLSYFDIYMSNPDKISLVIYKCPEKPDTILGRALLWTLNDGKKFMDRIYTSNDSDIQLFRQYAKENGWYYKYHNSSTDSGQAFDPEGNSVKLDLTVNIRKGYYKRYPYLDTLKYWSPDSGVISNSSHKGEYTLEDTGGDYSRCDSCGGSGRVECYDCSGGGEQDCSNCDGNGEIDCSNCSGSGEVDCSNCDGSGNIEDSEGNEVECTECSGSGRTDCSDCSGGGKEECDDCGGRGNVECENCSGNGEYDCSDCN